MKTLIKLNVAEKNLEKYVQEWVNEKAEEYEKDGIQGVLKDLSHGGCSSGYVSDLIYYKDTTEFCRKYQEEIWDLLYEQSKDMGQSILELISNLNGSKDVGSQDQLDNLLAWYAFEETARILADKQGIEI